MEKHNYLQLHWCLNHSRLPTKLTILINPHKNSKIWQILWYYYEAIET